MGGIKIIGVKVVGLCSKCRKKAKEYNDVPCNKYGRPYEDNEISCVGCALKPAEEFCLQKTFDTTCPHGYDQKDIRTYIDTVKEEVSKEFDGSPSSVIHKILDKFANVSRGEE